MTIAEVRAELAADSRVLLLVRHAERPRISDDDPSFGEAIALTPEGERTSRALGAALKGASGEVQFRASPLHRTVCTAQLIAAGMEIANPAIDEDDLIGNGSAFFADRVAVWKYFQPGGYFTKMFEYLRTGTAPGFAENAAAAREYEQYVLSRFQGQLGIFVTHDVFIAAYLNGWGVKRDWSRQSWPCFLDAAALVLRRDGSVARAFVRTGFSQGIAGVATK